MRWAEQIEWLALEAATALNTDHPLSAAWTGFAHLLLGPTMLKLGPLVIASLYVWLRPGGAATGRGVLADPGMTLRGAAGVAAVLAIGRSLQNFLPMRLRPRFARPEVFPEMGDAAGMVDWSSMPSDTAMLVGALVAATWAGSRPLALLSLAWGALFVCFPRAYFGFHYGSDIVVGWALGAALMALALKAPVPTGALDWVRGLDARRPRLVVLGLFVLGWQMIEAFGTARRLVAGVGKAARILNGDGSV